ncbi:MAG: hypothetical protein ISS78_00480 [Phycisphaerae bacterium]|nr:hypothetical protein [Phycisphaerae bacterium]
MQTCYRHGGAAHRAGGFTLVEVLFASVLVVLGFVALMAAFGYEAVAIQRGEDTTYGTFLANEIHDMALRMEFSSTFQLDDQTYSPALLSTGQPQDRTQYAQEITVTPVDARDLGRVVPVAGAEAACLTVTITAYEKPVVTQTYYLFSLAGVPFSDD